MSDAVIMSIVTGVLTLIGTMFSAYIALKMAELNRHAALAADKAAEVKVALEARTDATDAKLGVIHTLVNGAVTEQLRINAGLAGRVARDNPMDETAKAAALAASKLYFDHLAGQRAGT
jgi:hypothetical protein